MFRWDTSIKIKKQRDKTKNFLSYKCSAFFLHSLGLDVLYIYMYISIRFDSQLNLRS